MGCHGSSRAGVPRHRVGPGSLVTKKRIALVLVALLVIPVMVFLGPLLLAGGYTVVMLVLFALWAEWQNHQGRKRSRE